MSKKKKGSPPNVSVQKMERHIREAKKSATRDAVSLSLILMLTVLLDKYGMEDKIQSVYEDWNKLSDEVSEGRVKLYELQSVLKEEYGIKIEIGGKK